MTTAIAHADHYEIDGIKVPRVTSIIAAGFPYTGPDRPEARERGTRVHELCEFYDNGMTSTKAEFVGDEGYFEAWKKFREATGFEPRLNEKLTRSFKPPYAGTYDRMGVFDVHPDIYLIDIKTGSPSPSHALQTIAYKKAIGRELSRMAVYLRADGGYSTVHHTNDAEDWAAFKACLVLHQYKERYA